MRFKEDLRLSLDINRNINARIKFRAFYRVDKVTTLPGGDKHNAYRSQNIRGKRQGREFIQMNTSYFLHLSSCFLYLASSTKHMSAYATMF